MNRKSKPLWEYLESTGLLAHGTEAEIKAAKRQYRKDYLLRFKREQRKKKLEFTIRLNKESGELSTIAQAAKAHRKSIPAFIHAAAFAYLDTKYLVPDALQVAQMEQILSSCLNEIRTLISTKERFIWDRHQKLEKIEACIHRMEVQINDILRYPPKSHDHQTQNQ